MAKNSQIAFEIYCRKVFFKQPQNIEQPKIISQRKITFVRNGLNIEPSGQPELRFQQKFALDKDSLALLIKKNKSSGNNMFLI